MYGAVIERGMEMIVMEYCEHGSVFKSATHPRSHIAVHRCLLRAPAACSPLFLLSICVDSADF